MNERRAIIVGTAVLPLVAVIVCFVAARGSFERMTDAPRAFAGLLSGLALLSMAWKPKVGTRPRMVLISLTILLAVSSFLLHRNYLETKYRSYEEPARAVLVGQLAPALDYQHKVNVNSKDEATLAAMQGKIVLIDFWAKWCEPCVRTLPLLDDLQRRYPDRLLVVSITKFYGPDYGGPTPAAELEQIKEFVSRRGVQHPILVADTDDNIKSYRVETLPTVVTVGPDGRVSHYWVADRGVEDAIREITAMLQR